MADGKIIEDRLTQLDNCQLIAWQNALTRTLVALGVNGEASRGLPPQTVPEILASGRRT